MEKNHALSVGRKWCSAALKNPGGEEAVVNPRRGGGRKRSLENGASFSKGEKKTHPIEKTSRSLGKKKGAELRL